VQLAILSFILDRKHMNSSTDNPIILLRAQLWCIIMHILVVNYSKYVGLPHSDQKFRRLRIAWGGRMQVSSSFDRNDEPFKLSFPLSDLEWTCRINDSHFLLEHSANSELDIDQTSTLVNNNRLKHYEKVREQNIKFIQSNQLPFKRIRTYDSVSGCCDSALAFLASTILHSDQFLYSHKDSSVYILDSKVPNNFLSGLSSYSAKQKFCVIWLRPNTLRFLTDKFPTFLRKTSEFYNVIILPPSINIRSDLYRQHVFIADRFCNSMIMPIIFPNISDLFSVENKSESLFISDVQEAGWMFTSIGFNTVYLYHNDGAIHDVRPNGYCQYLDMEMSNNECPLSMIRSIESNKSQMHYQHEICRVYSSSIFLELFSLLDSV
jgi:hypothetical protein